MAISFKSHHVHMHREAHTQQSVTLNAFSDFPGKVGGWVGQKSKEIERCLVKPHQDTVAIASVLTAASLATFYSHMYSLQIFVLV
jgi:hypothetical protein